MKSLHYINIIPNDYMQTVNPFFKTFLDEGLQQVNTPTKITLSKDTHGSVTRALFQLGLKWNESNTCWELNGMTVKTASYLEKNQILIS